MGEDEKSAAPCGPYCGACIDYRVLGNCHASIVNAKGALLLSTMNSVMFTNAALKNVTSQAVMNAANCRVQNSFNPAVTLPGCTTRQL